MTTRPQPPLFHPGTLAAALARHWPAIVASVPAVLIPPAFACLSIAPLYLIQPALIAMPQVRRRLRPFDAVIYRTCPSPRTTIGSAVTPPPLRPARVDAAG